MVIDVAPNLDKVLVWLITVPLALAGGPPGLPVLNPVLHAADHGEHVLLPLGLPGGLGWQLGDELDIGEGAEQLLNSVVRDGVRPPQVGEGFVLYRD